MQYWYTFFSIKLDVHYSIEGNPEKTTYTAGDTVGFCISAENIGKVFTYVGHGAYAADLYIEVDGEPYYIYQGDRLARPESGTHKWQRGEVRSVEYAFVIPEDAPRGKYALRTWFEGVEQTFEDVLEIS